MCLFFFLFFFLMIRRPPRSTLFPTRRSSDLGLVAPRSAVDHVPLPHARGGPGSANPSRSEEHTSELQSRQYLVCRLLLEKKKKTNQRKKIPRIAPSNMSCTPDSIQDTKKAAD